MGCGVLNELVKNSFVLPQDAECLLQIGQLEIVSLHRVGDAGLRYSNLGLFRVGIAFDDFSSQSQFSRIGQFLRRPDTDVGKIAVGISRKWFGTTDTQLLVGE